MVEPSVEPRVVSGNAHVPKVVICAKLPRRVGCWPPAEVRSRFDRWLGRCDCQGLIQIGDQVIRIFNPDRNPHHIGGSTGGFLLFGR